MSSVYNSHYRRMNPWQRVKIWTERKFLKPHPYFSLFNTYDAGNLAQFPDPMNRHDPMVVYLKKVMKKYPQLRDSKVPSPMNPENPTKAVIHPYYKFVRRQIRLMDEGYSEEKAFELVEKDLSEELQQEKFERSVFEGLATSNRTRSLMSVYEQKAELEARQKIASLQREIPQFQRYQYSLETKYKEILNTKEEPIDKLNKSDKEHLMNYSPVTYANSNVFDKENNHKIIQKNFIFRSEKLINYFNSFAEIKDGISSLNDKDILLNARSSPKRLKDNLDQLIKKLEKFKIKLNSQGKIDFDKIHDKNALEFIKKKKN